MGTRILAVTLIHGQDRRPMDLSISPLAQWPNLARVNGVLYWDDYFNGGTARMITEFRNSNGAVLQSRRDQIRGNGGEANNIANKVGVLQLFNSTSSSNIRLRVGRLLTATLWMWQPEIIPSGVPSLAVMNIFKNS